MLIPCYVFCETVCGVALLPLNDQKWGWFVSRHPDSRPRPWRLLTVPAESDVPVEGRGTRSVSGAWIQRQVFLKWTNVTIQYIYFQYRPKAQIKSIVVWWQNKYNKCVYCVLAIKCVYLCVVWESCDTPWCCHCGGTACPPLGLHWTLHFHSELVSASTRNAHRTL